MLNSASYKYTHTYTIRSWVSFEPQFFFREDSSHFECRIHGSWICWHATFRSTSLLFHFRMADSCKVLGILACNFSFDDSHFCRIHEKQKNNIIITINNKKQYFQSLDLWLHHPSCLQVAFFLAAATSRRCHSSARLLYFSARYYFSVCIA